MVASGVEIRAVRPEEYATVGALTVEVYVGEHYVDAESPYVAELFDAATRASAAEVLVAARGGEVLGSLTVARPDTPYAALAGPDELEFRMLAVAKPARGSGVGTALVQTVLDTAAAEGFRSVVLVTLPDMREARRIYDRMGFVPVPERDWTTTTGVRTAVMRLTL